MDASALHQQGAQPHRARGTLSCGTGRIGHAVARRHESRGQGIRRCPERGGPRRSDPVTLCRGGA